MKSRTLVSLALGLVLPVGLIALWELAAARDWIDTLFYPKPSVVLDRTLDRREALLRDARVTFGRLLWGFVLGTGPGLLAGLAAGLSRTIRSLLYPLATALYVVPRIAMLPLVLVAFSINDSARIFMVAFSVFFIVFFSTLTGVEQVESRHIETARAFGAGRVRLALTVLLPGAAATIFAGFRVAMGFALIVIIGTEFLAANDGLGARIWTSYQIFDFPSMYAGIVAVTLLGIVLAGVLLLAERIAVPWRRS